MKHVFITKWNWCLKLKKKKKKIQAKHHFEYVSRSYLDDLFVCLVVAETEEFAICGEEGKWYF